MRNLIRLAVMLAATVGVHVNESRAYTVNPKPLNAGYRESHTCHTGYWGNMISVVNGACKAGDLIGYTVELVRQAGDPDDVTAFLVIVAADGSVVGTTRGGNVLNSAPYRYSRATTEKLALPSGYAHDFVVIELRLVNRLGKHIQTIRRQVPVTR